MKVLIAGSRGLVPSLVQVEQDLVTLHGRNPRWPALEAITEVVSGCCPNSPDVVGEALAAKHGWRVARFPADWDTYGRGAGPRRNMMMVRYADVGLFYWDGSSRGTRDCADKMRALTKPTIVASPYGVPGC